MPRRNVFARGLLLIGALALVIAALLLVLLPTGVSPADAQDNGTEVPAKPVGLQVDATAGSLDVSVNWDDVAGAEDYLVRWRAKDGDLNDGVRPTSSNAAITVSGYGRWVVQVKACNAAGCSEQTAQHFVVEPAPTPTPSPTPTATPTPAPQPPANPTGLQVTATAGSLDLSVDWDDVSGATSYAVRWRRPGADSSLSDGVTAQSSSATVTVSDYGSWVVRVEACNAAGCGPGASQAVLIRQLPPAMPENFGVSVTPGQLGLTATWDAVTGADTYRVNWRTPTGSFSTGNQVDTAATSASITVADYGRWWVRALACNEAGCGPGAIRVVDIAPPAPPGQPTGLEVESTAGSLSISVDWHDVAGADDYLVRWRFQGPNQALNSGVRSTSSETSITVASYGRWVVQVHGCNSAGCGPVLAQATNVTPGQPTNLAVDVIEGSLDLPVTWDAVTGADAYKVRWRTPTGTFEASNLVDTTATSASITVGDYGRWWVRVRACKGEMCGPGAIRVVDITLTSVCERAPQVRDALVSATGKACDEITAADLSLVVELDLSESGLTTLKANDMAGLISLKKLDLKKNKDLTALPQKALAASSNIETIELVHTGLTSLPSNQFANMPNLKRISLAANDLTTLPEEVFDGLSKLEYLDLAANDLTTLPAEVFDGLSNLEYLLLDANDLSMLDPNLFDGLSSLKDLRLNYNQLASLDADQFDGLTRLEQLPLHSNSLTALPSGVFDGLTSLHSLNLAYNNFPAPTTQNPSLPANVFQPLTGLKDLRLFGNPGAPFDLSNLGVASGATVVQLAFPPSNFEVKPGDGKVTLSWDKPDDADVSYEYQSYDFFRDRLTGNWIAIANPVESDGKLKHDITGLTSGDPYWYALRAKPNGYYSVNAYAPHTVVFGTTGNDTLRGPSGGSRHIVGLAGDDTLIGRSGPDILEGGAGNDTLHAGEGDIHPNTLLGGAGNDTLAASSGNDVLDGGPGTDIVSYEVSWVGVTLDLADPSRSTEHASGDTYTGIEKFVGSRAKDTLNGDGNANHFRGAGGDDTLVGNGGDDNLGGDAGDDTLTGGAGNDQFYFQTGFGNDDIEDYTLGATQAASEKIYLCMGTAAPFATHSGADSGSDHVITVTFNGTTQGTITLKGITTGAANFDNLNVIARAVNSSACQGH